MVRANKLVNYTVCLIATEGKGTSQAKKGPEACYIRRFRLSGTG